MTATLIALASGTRNSVSWAVSIRGGRIVDLKQFSTFVNRFEVDHPDFLFDLKHDGFRALAYI